MPNNAPKFCALPTYHPDPTPAHIPHVLHAPVPVINDALANHGAIAPGAQPRVQEAMSCTCAAAATI
eukprot:364404-Chlamydomonas_euryale.AAC.4